MNLACPRQGFFGEEFVQQWTAIRRYTDDVDDY